MVRQLIFGTVYGTVLGTLLGTALLCQAESPAIDRTPVTPPVDRVVVYKRQHKLVLLSQGKELKSYRVALGVVPVGPKQQRGDHRTPEGEYILDGRNPHSQYYKSFHISYPGPHDLASARERGVDPGGDIMLHGLPNGQASVGKAHLRADWTEGCIAVTDEEMDELWSLIPVGTPIEIEP